MWKRASYKFATDLEWTWKYCCCVINMLHVLEGFEEEKWNIQEELFNRKMGQL
jgi:hypothetical protein